MRTAQFWSWLLIVLGVAVGFWQVADQPAIAHNLYLHRLEDLIAETPANPTLRLTALGLAIALGALHALAPGHGKTMVAAYLTGSRGTPWQAVTLGLVTTLTHTIGVFGLGVLTLIASRYVLPEQLYPVLSLLSGLTVCVVGFQLLKERLSPTYDPLHSHSHANAPGHSHGHPHAHSHLHPPDQAHSHSDEHSHDHPHDHSHDPSTSWPSLVALGIAGGMVPCPSALVLMLSAIAFHQTLFGLFLVGGFSLGLAGVLTGLGLAVVYAQQWLNRLPAATPALKYLPVLSAVVIFCTGLGLTVYAMI
ncbi:MAG TPA: sulfite exporter TauE/SafE family protein [Synechococcales cyanobacterium M55_K2018_004]|nr:sulfite exporter TauE/SafE family protein [Synechococcales cyanobacterium M55_K2018_004]